MNKENVDELYAKFGKNVPKEKRGNFKSSLEKADDSKFAALKNVKPASKSPLKGINGLVCFFATLLGAVFLACNLIAFLYVTPTYTEYSQYSAKLSDDLSAYYDRVSGFGKVDGSASTDGNVLLTFENQITLHYGELQKDLAEKKAEYDKKYSEYRQDTVFVGNKTTNYLNVKIQLAEVEEKLADLTEPAEGTANYEELKQKYDADKKALEEQKTKLEERIADYEERSTNLTIKYDELTAAYTAYDEAVKSFETAASEIFEQLADYYNSADYESYKNSLYKMYLGGNAGIISYLNKCNNELIDWLAAYSKALDDYLISGQEIATTLPENITVSETSVAAVKANYEEAVSNLKAYALKVAEYRVVYNKYVKDNADELAKHTKISADINTILVEKEKKEEDVVKEAKELLASYKKAVDAFETEENKEENKNYLAAKELYDTLNAALDGKTDAEIPQSLKQVLDAAAEWFDGYNAQIKVYQNTLADYDAVLSLFNFTSYANRLVTRIELTAEIEAETDDGKKETLNSHLTALNESIAVDEVTVDLYQSILDDEAWTDDYYVQYCKNNDADEDFAAKKSSYERISNAASSLGNSQNLKLVSDKVSLSLAINGKQVNAYESEVAYYAVEQLTMRLQTALNVSKDLLNEVSDYYVNITTADLLDWVEISDGTRKTVHKDLSYSSHVQAVKSALNALTKTDVSTLLFEKFDLETALKNIDNKETVSINEFVKNLNFTDKINTYIDAASDVKTFCDAALLASRSDYTVPVSTVSNIMLVFDLIMIAIFAGYFAYVIYNAVSTAKKENYEKLEELLAD